jgi:hypothetical protein
MSLATSPLATNPSTGESLVLLVQGESKLVARRFDPSTGQFGASTQLTGADSTASGTARVRFGPKGKAIAIWAEREPSGNVHIKARVFAAGEWQSGTAILSSGGTGVLTARQPDIAFDDAGNAVAVWTEEIAAFDIKSSMRSARFVDQGGTWLASEAVTGQHTGLTRDIGARAAFIKNGDAYIVVATRVQADLGGGSSSLVAYRCAVLNPNKFGCLNGGNGGDRLPAPVGSLAGDALEFDLASSAERIQVAWQHKYASNARTSVWTTTLPDNELTWTSAQPVDLAGEAVEGGTAGAPRISMVSGASVIAWCQKLTISIAAGCFVRKTTFAPASFSVYRLDSPGESGASAFDGVTMARAPSAEHWLFLWTRETTLADGTGSTQQFSLMSRTFDLATGLGATIDPVAAPSKDKPKTTAVSLDASGKGLAVWSQGTGVMANPYAP